MLPRALSEIYSFIRDYFVYTEGDKILALGALHIIWQELAEIRSVAVVEEAQGKGIGSKIVRKCLTEAKKLGIKKVFVLTYIPRFFEKFGFKEVNKRVLPHKVWSDCFDCPEFPNCGEVAMLLKI
jgi:amino-acid N-acetyltransferase